MHRPCLVRRHTAAHPSDPGRKAPPTHTPPYGMTVSIAELVGQRGDVVGQSPAGHVARRYPSVARWSNTTTRPKRRIISRREQVKQPGARREWSNTNVVTAGSWAGITTEVHATIGKLYHEGRAEGGHGGDIGQLLTEGKRRRSTAGLCGGGRTKSASITQYGWGNLNRGREGPQMVSWDRGGHARRQCFVAKCRAAGQPP